MNNESMPLVSVVVPCYNHENFVQECIQSIIDQDYQNIELIIIDDGSKDQSVQKIKEMICACEVRFVRFEFRHRHNKGLCATLNEALEWCEGVYYSAIASDDIMLPNKTAIQIKELLNSQVHNVIGIFAGIKIFGDNINNIGKGKNRIYRFNDIFLHDCIMTTPTFMVLRDKIIEVEGYDENILVEDLDLFLRLTAKDYKLMAIEVPLVLYRRHEDNLSSKHEIILEAVITILNKYKNHHLHKQALSIGFMVAAHSAQASKKKSWGYMLKAIHIYPMNILSLSFIKYIIKGVIR